MRFDLAKYYEFPDDNLDGLTIEMIWQRKKLPPPAPGDPHIWFSRRNEHNPHWHGTSRQGEMECRGTLRDATQWILEGGQDESW